MSFYTMIKTTLKKVIKTTDKGEEVFSYKYTFK